MFTIEKIENAHKKVKSGADFPKYIKEIKKFGVFSFETWTRDSHTVYYGKDNYTAQSQPQYEVLMVSKVSNIENFTFELKKHQKGETNYFEFCKNCAENGIEKWIVDLEEMKCIYFDMSGNEILTEMIPF